MKPNFRLLLVVALFIGQIYRLNSQSWTAAERYSSPGNSLLTSTSTALASDGAMYVVGNFQNMACFDTIILNAPSPNRTNGYLLKLNAQMQPVWARQFPENPYDITVDAQENVLLVGSRWNAAGSDDTLAYVAKYNAGGTLIATFYSTGTAKNWGKVVRTDASGNCYVAGERNSSGTAVFGTFSFPPTNSRECFLLKFPPDLSQVLWAKYTGLSANLDNVYDIEIDEVNGFVYASGNYSQNYSPPIIGCGCYSGDFFVEKHQTSTGISVWKKIFSGGSGDVTKQFIRLDPSGQNLSVVACFKKTTTFDASFSLTANTNLDYHIYIAQISAANADVQWARKISTSGDSFLWRVARKNDDLWLYGHFRKQTAIGSFVLNPSSYDGFIAKITADGTVVEAERLFGNSTENGFGLAQRDTVVAITGTSMSSSMSIGAFNLPGTTNSAFVARKGGLQQLPPIAGFEANVNSGCVPLSVQFTQTAHQSPTSFQWQFSGGIPSSSTDKNPSVTYTTPGIYNVTLRVSNGGGADTLVQVGYITVSASNPTSVFSNTSNGLAVNFTNNSTNATAYLWDFGDGQTSSEASPSHTYTDCGTYVVTLTSSNICGTASSTYTLIFGNGLPTAVFSSIQNGLTVSFSNTSSNAMYVWDFGDGQTSNEESPIHQYAACGVYTVTLTSTNTCGTASSTATLTVTDFPDADFNTLVNGLEVSLLNTSTGGTSYFWDFGDGNTSIVQNPPPHVYADSGTYVITLVVSNNCGATIFEQTVTITKTVGTEMPEWIESFSVFPNPAKDVFNIALKGSASELVEFVFYASGGQEIFRKQIDFQLGTLTQAFETADLPAGVYLLRISVGKQLKFAKVVVQR